MAARYDQIGTTYTSTRAADPRIVARLVSLLSLPVDANIIDIGAGTGNYSQALAAEGFHVTAAEPSPIMRSQGKTHPRLTWTAACSEQLPFADGQFDGAVMTLCLHHFADWQKGMTEALRVSNNGPLAIFAFDIEHPSEFWLFDYFPDLGSIDKTLTPRIDELRSFVDQQPGLEFSLQSFPLPRDLIDHFAAADWAHPHRYLQKEFRNGISTFHQLDEKSLQKGLNTLQSDLDDGSWHRKYGQLLELEFCDRGYVFIRVGAEQ
jgi:ubiquinone/menaquinone biosynthesis C-methylase UbiE